MEITNFSGGVFFLINEFHDLKEISQFDARAEGVEEECQRNCSGFVWATGDRSLFGRVDPSLTMTNKPEFNLTE